MSTRPDASTRKMAEGEVSKMTRSRSSLSRRASSARLRSVMSRKMPSTPATAPSASW